MAPGHHKKLGREKWLVLVGRPSLAAFRWRARRPAPPSYFPKKLRKKFRPGTRDPRHSSSEAKYELSELISRDSLKFVPRFEVVERHPDGLIQGSGEALSACIRDGDIGAFALGV